MAEHVTGSFETELPKVQNALKDANKAAGCPNAPNTQFFKVPAIGDAGFFFGVDRKTPINYRLSINKYCNA
ncbi:hypothetical protein [Pseudomonas sp. GL-B-19]|uniref:hypothetical protein n=1 Tax=Pseudomonas sp. GL-B-19 TaxID=2832393 RepID=UPI001CBD5BFC|nr:hypothetical protein [Pseudomonas sp. GL-B-19]